MRRMGGREGGRDMGRGDWRCNCGSGWQKRLLKHLEAAGVTADLHLPQGKCQKKGKRKKKESFSLLIWKVKETVVFVGSNHHITVQLEPIDAYVRSACICLSVC